MREEFENWAIKQPRLKKNLTIKVAREYGGNLRTIEYDDDEVELARLAFIAGYDFAVETPGQ
jgi:hypothetical protein